MFRLERKAVVSEQQRGIPCLLISPDEICSVKQCECLVLDFPLMLYYPEAKIKHT